MQDEDSNTTWKMMKMLAEIIQSINGEIFGGFPRDIILHNHFAQLFYKEPNVDLSKYSDTSYLPDLKHRNHLPRDIDMYITTEMFEIFLKKLDENRFDFKVIDGKGYNLPDGVKHKKMTVTFAVNPILSRMQNISRFYVNIDIIYFMFSGMNVPHPFGNIDFECNGLILSNNEFKLSPNILSTVKCPLTRYTKLTSIIDDIINHRAVMLYTCNAPVERYRVTKMLSTGWSVVTPNMITCVGSRNDEDICPLCLDNFKDCLYTKFTCCKCTLYYHGHCVNNLDGADFNNSCPQCRTDIHFTDADRLIYRPQKTHVRRRLSFTNLS